MMKTKTRLPDKLSELLRVALVDLEKCEDDSRYFINMDVWHSGAFGGICHVCLAGSVMAQSIGLDRTEFKYPGSLGDRSVVGKLRAINFLRMGEVGSALAVLRDCDADRIIGRGHALDRDNIALYQWQSTQFKADMRQLADDLEAAGL